MKKTLWTAALFSTVFLFGSAKGGIIKCGSCDTVSKMAGYAKSGGPGDHIVYSLQHGLISGWSVSYDFTDPSSPPKWSVEQTALPVSVTDEFEVAVAIYDAAGGKMTADANIEFSETPLAQDFPNATAYEVVSDFSLRQKLADHIGSNAFWIGGFEATISAGLRMVGLFEGPVLTVVVTMDDGSIVVYTAELTGPEGELAQYSKDRSRTSDGEPIPEANTAAYQGSYSGGSFGAIDRLREYLQTIGVVVPTQLRPDGPLRLVCTWGTVGGVETLICHQQ